MGRKKNSEITGESRENPSDKEKMPLGFKIILGIMIVFTVATLLGALINPVLIIGSYLLKGIPARIALTTLALIPGFAAFSIITRHSWGKNLLIGFGIFSLVYQLINYLFLLYNTQNVVQLYLSMQNKQVLEMYFRMYGPSMISVYTRTLNLSMLLGTITGCVVFGLIIAYTVKKGAYFKGTWKN